MDKKTMTREQMEYKYKYRTEVWKEDVRCMADTYEERIKQLENEIIVLRKRGALWRIPRR